MMTPPAQFHHTGGFSFSSRRIRCPICGARRGFAPLADNGKSGKCFACNVFLPPGASGSARGYPQKPPALQRREPERVLLKATPSRLWSNVPVATTYDYHDETGRVLYHIDRRERRALYRLPDGAEQWEAEKTFQQRPHGVERAFPGCMNGIRRVLYRLPCVLQAIRHGWPVIIVEGEKDADTYNDLFREELAYDARATCCPGGAGRWLTYGTGYCESLRGADVILDGDMDAAGLLHVRSAADALYGIARRVRIVPDLIDALREGTGR